MHSRPRSRGATTVGGTGTLQIRGEANHARDAWKALNTGGASKTHADHKKSPHSTADAGLPEVYESVDAIPPEFRVRREGHRAVGLVSLHRVPHNVRVPTAYGKAARGRCDRRLS